MRIVTRSRHDELVFEFPDLKLLRLMARSILLAAAVLSFPLLRSALRYSEAAASPEPLKWTHSQLALPLLVKDLKQQGLLASGATAILLGHPRSRLFFMSNGNSAVEDRSVDFLLVTDGLSDSTFGFVDRVLKVGGVVAVRLGTDPARSFRLPKNYRVAYVRRFGSTVVAIKKTSHADASKFQARRLVPFAESKREDVRALEDALEELRIKISPDECTGEKTMNLV